jgi:hypothetical protein
VRYFPDKLPIGIGADGEPYVLVYLVTRDVPIEFRAFLERHAELWRTLPAWTLRALVPRHLREVIPLYTDAFREQLVTPLRPSSRSCAGISMRAQRRAERHTNGSTRLRGPFRPPGSGRCIASGPSVGIGAGCHPFAGDCRRDRTRAGAVGVPDVAARLPASAAAAGHRVTGASRT